MFLRQLAVLLAVALPLAAQSAAPARVDVVVTDQQGKRIGGLSAVDFEILENDEKRPVLDFVEYSPTGRVAEPVTDPRYVSLVTPASPTPPRRIVLLADDASKAQAVEFIEKQKRARDVIVLDENKGDLTARIAAAALQLARYPEKKAIVVFAEAPENAKTFAAKRGVSVITPDAAEDLTGYYSLGFQPKGGGSTVHVRTTRELFVARSVLATAQPLAEDAAGDAVLAHQFVAPQTNDLGIALALAPAQPVAGKRQVKLQVLVPIRNLSFAHEGNEVMGGFDVLTSIGDGKGRFTRVNRQSHAIRWPHEALDQAGDRSITYAFDVMLEDDASLISVGVIDQRSKKTGFARIEVPK